MIALAIKQAKIRGLKYEFAFLSCISVFQHYYAFNAGQGSFILDSERKLVQRARLFAEKIYGLYL